MPDVHEPITGSSGAATGAVVRLRRGERTMVVKSFRPVTSGRHVEAARDPRHFAYWRREPLAYASGLLPSGPFRAPRCYAVTDEAVYLEDVQGKPESPEVAARRLARWQSETAIPDVPWLAGHQLAQRIAVAELAPPYAAVWDRRFELLDALGDVPSVVSHGDFHPVNLLHRAGETVVLDWGTFCTAPVGADLAHLALGTGRDLLAEYAAASPYGIEVVRRGYAITLALTAASRAHWMRSRGLRVPEFYEEVVLGLPR